MGILINKEAEEFVFGSQISTGYGYGDGSGYGYSYGDGSGYGYGYGYGDGDGSGYGDGDGNIGIFNDYKVYMIDHVQTIISSAHKNIARGFIINKDFTLEKTFIAKGQNNMFAHGSTIKEAMKSLREKILKNLEPEETIEKFKKKFKKDKEYKGTDFYEWHHYLTGSCKQGRDNFVRNHELDLNKKYSVKFFIDICKDDYNGEIIKRLEKEYE